MGTVANIVRRLIGNPGIQSGFQLFIFYPERVDAKIFFAHEETLVRRIVDYQFMLWYIFVHMNSHTNNYSE